MTTSNFAHLEPVRKHAPATQVAKNIRKDLKMAFPRVKFSVVSSSYNCIRVKWEDGPTTKEVDKLLSKFKLDYLFTNREHTKATLQMAIDHLWLAFPVELASFEKPNDCVGTWVVIPGMDIEVASAISLVAHAYDCVQGQYVTEDTFPEYIVRRVSEVHNHVKH